MVIGLALTSAGWLGLSYSVGFEDHVKVFTFSSEIRESVEFPGSFAEFWFILSIKIVEVWIILICKFEVCQGVEFKILSNFNVKVPSKRLHIGQTFNRICQESKFSYDNILQNNRIGNLINLINWLRQFLKKRHQRYCQTKL